LYAASLHAPKEPLRRVELTIVKPKAVEAPPPPPPEPRKVEKPKPKAQMTPLPDAPKPTAEPPPPPTFGLSFSSVGQGNPSFSVPVGNTTMTAQAKGPSGPAKPLSGAGTSRGPAVSLAQVSKMPTVVGECPPGNPRSLYTEDAIRHEIEGRVQLEVTVDADGQVSTVRVKKGLGYGLDEAALQAMKEKCHFQPAEVDGHKVSTVIRYDFAFVLD
jgi:protein TonB